MSPVDASPALPPTLPEPTQPSPVAPFAPPAAAVLGQAIALEASRETARYLRQTNTHQHGE
jgi:hypothetical protein